MYADVVIEYPVKSLDKCFTYGVPKELLNIIKNGMKVRVPFNNTYLFGIITCIHNNNPSYEVKDIKEIVNKDIYLNEELLLLGKYLKEETLCSLISAYQVMFPSTLKINKDNKDYSKYDTYLELNDTKDNVLKFINDNKRKIKQNELLLSLVEGKKLKKLYNNYLIKPLLDISIIKEIFEKKYRINNIMINNKDIKLNCEQEKAYKYISDNKNTYNTFLLYGVTGSGKTEVYMNLIEDTIKENKSAIVLVPEICLTTQTVQRFYNRFGNNVAIFHSGLSDGEKYDEYLKIYHDEVKIVVGTRSSIFVPIKNLGLIIIDEEHSDSYKQESNPRYNAIDMAIFRAKFNNIPLILASATPSLESMSRTLKNVYKLVTLTKRANNMLLPKTTLIDMENEAKKGNYVLSKILIDAINERLNNKEQIILLLNRRGHSTFITCKNCGYTYKCPNCDVTLTYHKTSNSLRCHLCGYYKVKDDKCPNCNEDGLSYLGLGTEKVEELLKTTFSTAKIIRMDQDTTTKKNSYQNIINSFENQEYDILLGTQMISKGLDFKNVTLVGIINADTSLNIPDFRSNEKTFSLLYQTSGRSGRDKKEGEVLIQTFNKDNKVLNFVKNNDYMSFYKYEMDIRHKLKYPPYTYICEIIIKSKSYDSSIAEATKIKRILNNKLVSNEIILGPNPASIFRLNNIYSFAIIIKYTKENNLKKVIKDIDISYINNKNINIDIIFNPIKF